MAEARGIVESSRVGGWQIWGKTGSAFPRRADRSFDRAKGWGWYVGWAERDGRRVVFARLTQAEAASKTSTGIATRQGLLADWPVLMEKAGR
jgi:beta-lactamase class D